MAFNSYKKRLEKGETEPEAVNHTAIELTQAAEVFYFYLLLYYQYLYDFFF